MTRACRSLALAGLAAALFTLPLSAVRQQGTWQRTDTSLAWQSGSNVVWKFTFDPKYGKPFFDPTFDYLGFPSTVKASRAAYEMAGITARDVSFAEVHDCFTWTEISNTEDLGFCAKGDGWKLVEEGRTALDGDIPINTSGGLKSFGHPIGASGVRMIYEVVTQLRGEAGARQVKNPKLGVAHNVGGPGAVACVVVLGN